MMTTLKKLIYICSFIIGLANTNAKAQNASVGIAFHLTSAVVTTADYNKLDNMVCGINYEFSRLHTGISFYIDHIIPNDIGGAKKSHIDIYQTSSAPQYLPLDDIINGMGTVNVMVHEIGHALGLQHPDGVKGGLIAGCDCNGVGGGGQDCCLDTDPSAVNPDYWSNNYMMQGATLGSGFSPDQINRMHWCMSQRGWNVTYSPGGPVLTTSPGLPWTTVVEKTDVEEADITFQFPTNCAGYTIYPDYVEVIVTTFCDEGYAQHEMAYVFNNLTQPVSFGTIHTEWGIRKIKYIYHWGSYVYEITHNFNIPAAPGSFCSLIGYPEKSTSIKNQTNSIKDFQLINTIARDVLFFENNNFKTAEIHDINGKIILVKRIEKGSSSIDISSLPSGIYIIRSSNNTHVQYDKFIKE